MYTFFQNILRNLFVFFQWTVAEVRGPGPPWMWCIDVGGAGV